ncbi:N-acyl-D-amino-acid deacylase family protein [Paremcibacter congregatus]|uniref:Aminoacylase n=1 Tax=Paremcibacter congregatus TaxID=2043170 RepID=A0A2G4YVM5_9PROT|nr:D-aminoacylase [Paremcibacter congregatus]PHZ86379.1 aminoacylase [Paremcibacter congregatus]QDE28524.1 D-aminoacylase [Paremcibacter congregatus]
MSNAGLPKFLLNFVVGLGVFALGACSPKNSPPQSWIVENVSIVDGMGTPAYAGSVRILAGKIVEVGQLTKLPSEVAVAGKGLILAPGFIDTHSHHDAYIEQQRDVIAATSQGITTIVIGQDGFSNYPLSEFYQQRRERPVAVNIASYVGHNSIRGIVLGEDYRRKSTEDELSKMEALLQKEMQAGAIGLSTGLEYDPGIYASRREVLQLAQITAEQDGRYISHIRSEDKFLFEAVDEIISIGRKTGMPIQISHVKLAMKSLWGRAPELLEKLNAARAEGIEISADIYPYEYWASVLEVMLPERNFDDRSAVKFALDELAPPEGLVLAIFAADPSLEGKTVAAIAKERGEDPIDTYLALLKQSKQWQTDNPNSDQVAESVMGRSMTSEDIVTLLNWEHTNLCTDGAHIGHPRGVGSYPRVLGKYVRNDKIMSIEEAVRKMTSLAAHHMGFSDRGKIKPGYSADMVLFDPKTIIDRANFRDMSKLSEGVAMVWVNGKLVFQDGQATGARPGQLITRRIITE